jgi:hypothetical protein
LNNGPIGVAGQFAAGKSNNANALDRRGEAYAISGDRPRHCSRPAKFAKELILTCLAVATKRVGAKVDVPAPDVFAR